MIVYLYRWSSSCVCNHIITNHITTTFPQINSLWPWWWQQPYSKHFTSNELSIVVFSRIAYPNYACLIDIDRTVLIISPFASYIEAQLIHNRTCIHPLNQDVLPVFSYITIAPPLPPYVPLKDFQNPLAFNSTWTDEYVVMIDIVMIDIVR